MRLLLKLREEGCFGNKNEVSIKALAEWAAKGKFFLSAQDNHLVSKTIEEEMGEMEHRHNICAMELVEGLEPTTPRLRSEFPR